MAYAFPQRVSQFVQITNISSPASVSGGNLVVNFPNGYTYHKVYVNLGNTTSSAYINSNTYLQINGLLIQQYLSFTDYQEELSYYGLYDAVSGTQILVFYLDRPKLLSTELQELTAIYTGKRQVINGVDTGPEVNNMILNIGFTADPALVIGNITVFADVSNDINPPQLWSRKQVTLNIGGAIGQVNSNEIQKNELIDKFIFTAASTVLTRVQLYLDNVITWDRTFDMNALIQRSGTIARVPDITYAFVIEPGENGDGRQTISPFKVDGSSVSSFYAVLYTASAVPSINLIVRTFTTLPNSGTGAA